MAADGDRGRVGNRSDWIPSAPYDLVETEPACSVQSLIAAPTIAFETWLVVPYDCTPGRFSEASATVGHHHAPANDSR